MKQLTVSELVYNAIEVSAAEAAFHAFEDEQRGRLGRGLGEFDDLDAARDRLGGPRHRARAFFNSLSTADLRLLTTIYYAARDWRGTNDGDEVSLDPEKEVRRGLEVTQKHSEQASRDFCLRKMNEVMGSVRVAHLHEGLLRFGDVALRLREEFARFETL